MIASPSHRPAVRDLELPAQPELRPVRLLLDYWKPELGLADHRILQTIVVFRSTRLLDPELASRRMAEAEQASTPSEVAHSSTSRPRARTETPHEADILGVDGTVPGASSLA